MNKLLFILLAMGACTYYPHESSTDHQTEDSLKMALVYISSRGEGFNIYKNSPEGSEEIQLTQDPGWEWYPQWNRTKKEILINTQDTAGNFEMKCIDREGNYLSYEGRKNSSYFLSPTGEMGAYTVKKGDNTTLWIFPLENEADSQLVADEGTYNGRPEWSPDGNQLLFISDRSGSNELYLYSLDTQQTRRLTHNDWREKYTSWSPNGTHIASTFAKGDAANDIYLIELATGEAKALTQTPINESEISWSPKGDLIAYHAQVDEKDDIFTLNIQSGEVVKITQGEGYHGEPIWILE